MHKVARKVQKCTKKAHKVLYTGWGLGALKTHPKMTQCSLVGHKGPLHIHDPERSEGGPKARGTRVGRRRRSGRSPHPGRRPGEDTLAPKARARRAQKRAARRRRIWPKARGNVTLAPQAACERSERRRRRHATKSRSAAGASAAGLLLLRSRRGTLTTERLQPKNRLKP